ncbi:Mov34/MPN/PAD-1 family protein [Candidatus Bipolaricaulota bacterium]|nr:Mov34/MPN/PAD-1 family protein [Candidatus Bipolaricaulota bacterium]
MIKMKEDLEKEAVTGLIDLIFDGRGQETKTIGEPDSFSLENMSKKVQVRALLEEEVDQIEEKIQNMVLEKNFDQDKPLEHLMSLARTWKAMKLLTSDEIDELPEVFVMDVLFLKECYRSLFPGEEEVFLTGVKTGKINVVTRKIEIETKSTENKVEDLPESSYRELRKIDKQGMPFLGIFHSHPQGFSPRPSKRDLEQFEKYEDHGFRALGGIFTRNGSIRFFAQHLDFEVMVTGTGIEKKREETLQN